MRRKGLYVAFAGCLALCASCVDSMLGVFGSSDVELEITLNMPGNSSAATRAMATRVGGDNQTYDDLDYETDYQYYIGTNDVYVLLFEADDDEDDSNDVLYKVPNVSLAGKNGDDTRTITGSLSEEDADKTLTVDVLVNLAQNECNNMTKTSDITGWLRDMAAAGYTREEVYKAIGTFSYPEVTDDNPYGVWKLDPDNGERYLPMWGKTSGTLTIYKDVENTCACNLYRSVAKMGVMVDGDCETFELREIYLYYINEEGKFVSSKEPNSSINVQYTEPDVPDGVDHRDIEHPLVYKDIPEDGSYLNQIYLAEADNQNVDDGEPVVMVVGGIYKGGDYEGEGLGVTQEQINYYRIDMIDDSGGYTDANGVFNIIRNHSYVFNILNANNPGTSDPDPRRAAAGLEVEILDYTDVPMHGINAQYTFTVNQSLFSFEGATTSVGDLIINTDGTGWELVTDDDTPDWLHVTDISDHTNVNDTVTIEPEDNVNNDALRNGSFWIKCGKVMKKINVVQDYTETANSVIVTQAGTYDLKVDVRGNGNTQAWTNDTGTNMESIDFDLGNSISDVAYVDIIWETADGFVTIDDPYSISESGCISYKVDNVELDTFGDWSGFVFDPGNGANALIGAFSEDGELLWTYHIWAVGDYAADGDLTEKWQAGTLTGDNSTQYNTENESANITARYTEYEFMDRNLGAYSNLPGSASFGLLYQWGRKDPFIGAYRENSEQDYHTVRKQYTYHHETVNGYYLWEDFDDSSYDDSKDEEGNLVKYLIQHPTSLMQNGLLSDTHSGDEAHGLWGTTSYTFDDSELGNKTMYDPCPAGYRVPSLNALTFYDGANNMWYIETNTIGSGQNATEQVDVAHSSQLVRYVPIPADGSSYMTGGYSANYVSNAPFYGFWFDYHGDYGFADSYGDTNGYGVNSFTEGDDTSGWIPGYVKGKPDGVTWLPLAGIYNGSIEHFGRAGLTDKMTTPNGPGDNGPGGNDNNNSGESEGAYLPASSLQVTSVLWANSPTSTNTNFPAGLLLHGTEGAYAPLNTSGDYFEYAAGEVGDSNENTLATSGEGYWTTADTGYGGTAVAWWTGSVDADKASMSSVSSGTWNYSSSSAINRWSDANGLPGGGRHFHSYADPNLSTLANPSYAASVRCIRDKDALVHRDDEILLSDAETKYDGSTLLLYDYDETGETIDAIELVISYVEEWEVSTPGAKWISISPSSESTTDSSGATSTIKITYNADYLPSDTDDTTATITIKFARGTTKTITIEYVGGTRPNTNTEDDGTNN